MRSLLRAILTAVLLLGGGLGDWAPGQAAAHESCCCGTPASVEDACPCPKPEGNRGPQGGGCSERTTQTALAAQATPSRQAQAARRLEPSPAPRAVGARIASRTLNLAQIPVVGQGRAPDLGRHLASLGHFRI